MLESTKDFLPNEWWAVSQCVDAYESQAGKGFPNLRTFADRAQPEHKVAALVELVKVDFERRWQSGDKRHLEDYLREYPELSTSDSIEDLAEQEFLVRSSHGDAPSIDELKSRFPQIDERRVLSAPQRMVATLPLQSEPPATAPLDTAEFSLKGAGTEGTAEFSLAQDGPSGTVVYDANQTTDAAGQSTHRGSGHAHPTVHPKKPAQRTEPEETLTEIGRYTVQRKLGAGSFGTVYQCFDPGLSRSVAIKMPHRKGAAADKVKEFLHEAQSAARLRHPGVVKVLDSGQTADGRVYIVYDFIKGKTLQERMDAGSYTHEEAARWVAEVAEGLAHAHKNRIVHRDIKPANILLDEEERTLIADFGLAKMDDTFFKDDTGKVLGTVAYMSPEQAAGESHWASPQTDIYSLGVMFYQMLCRKLPFSSGSIEEVLQQIKRRPATPPRTIDDKIPKQFEEICLKAMAKNPEDRYKTAGDMAADLRTVLAGEPPKKSGAAGWVLAFGGAAAAAAALLLIFKPWEEQKIKRTSNRSGSAQDAGLDELNLAAGTPKLEVHYQGATEKGIWRPMSGKAFSLHEGDRIQLQVTLQGDVPRYVYLYWYDAKGVPDRKWPIDVANQKKVTRVVSPDEGNADLWWEMDNERGAEMALVAVRDEPMTASQLAEFEGSPAFGKGSLRLDEVYHVASGDVERGLKKNAVVSRKDPIAKEFSKRLNEQFEAFHGMVMPHQ